MYTMNIEFQPKALSHIMCDLSIYRLVYPNFDFFICAPIWPKFGIRGKFDVLIPNIIRNLILKVDLV